MLSKQGGVAYFLARQIRVSETWMVRQANPVDFWRGFALVTIFINHIPGIYYWRFTHGNISISDSADLFVFLAGWSLRYLVGTGHGRRRPGSWCSASPGAR